MAFSRPAIPLTAPAVVGGDGGVRRERFDLPASASAVALARERVCGQLRRWGLSEDLGDMAQLVVSEFFTNAVVHTDSGRVHCLLQVRDQRLRIEVADEGEGRCEDVLPRDAGAEEVNGRGLQLVSAVAENWGVTAAQPGRVVWAELSLRAL